MLRTADVEVRSMRHLRSNSNRRKNTFNIYNLRTATNRCNKKTLYIHSSNGRVMRIAAERVVIRAVAGHACKTGPLPSLSQDPVSLAKMVVSHL